MPPLIPVVAFIAFTICIVWVSIKTNQHNEAFRKEEKRRNLVVNNMDKVKTVETARKNLEILKDVKLTISKMAPNVVDYLGLDDDIKDAQEIVDELSLEKIENKVNPMLDDLLHYYTVIMDGDFNDVDRLVALRNKCITILQKYINICLHGEYTISSRGHMMEYFGEEYDPCMDNSTDLKAKLDRRIMELRPEKERKLKIISQMLSLVEREESIMRANLLKTQFNDCTADELKSCYREMVDKNRLAEIKIGNRYFVMLSDKEKKKRQPKKTKQEEGEPS